MDKQLFEAMDAKIDSLENEVNALTKELAGGKRASIESGAKEKRTDKELAKKLGNEFARQKEYKNFEAYVETKTTSTDDTTAGLTIEELLANEVVEYAIENQAFLSAMRQMSVPQGEQYFRPVLLTRPTVEDTVENVSGTVVTETAGATWGRLEANFTKAFSMPAFTNEIINDSTIDVVGMTNRMVGEEYGFHFINQQLFGRWDLDSTQQLKGILTNRIDLQNGFTESYKLDADRDKEYFQVIPTGVAGGLPATSPELVDFLIDVQTSLNHEYQDSAAWYMSKETFGVLRKVKVGADDMRPVLSDGFGTLNQTFMLLGKPVVIVDQMPQVGADQAPIIYGDLQQAIDFLQVEGSSQYVLDPYTIKGQQLHYRETRYGQCMNNYDAIRVVICAVQP